MTLPTEGAARQQSCREGHIAALSLPLTAITRDASEQLASRSPRAADLSRSWSLGTDDSGVWRVLRRRSEI